MDYICHHAHSYHHGVGDRHARVTFSLTEMGITTTSAFLTTVSASLVLALCTHVTIFAKFGVFLVTCMFFSIVVAETFFHGMLAWVGPEDFSQPIGEALLRSLRGGKPGQSSDPSSQSAPVGADMIRLVKAGVAAASLVLAIVIAFSLASGEENIPGSAYNTAAVCEDICMSGYQIRGSCVPVGVSPLQYYVELPDDAYTFASTGQRFRVTSDLYGNPLAAGVRVDVLNMTSQRWLTDRDSSQPFWWHLVVVMVPDNLDTALDTAFLYITGGSNRDPHQRLSEDDDELILMATMAQQTATVTVLLKHVPNEPISFPSDHSGALACLKFCQFRLSERQRFRVEPGIYPDGRSEDAIIAFTWMKFVLEEPTNPEWLARFPMTKAVSKAMDTVTTYMDQAQSVTINDFVVAGASKRGYFRHVLPFST